MNFKLEIYTPQEKLFEGDVESISFDSLSGRMQILSRHIPIVAGVKAGIIKVLLSEDNIKIKVSDGILDFEKNVCKIFVSSAEKQVN